MLPMLMVLHVCEMDYNPDKRSIPIFFYKGVMIEKI